MTRWQVKIIKKDGTIRTKQATSYARIMQFLQASHSPECVFKVHVGYGKHSDSNGQLNIFENAGEYTDYQSVRIALKAFQEIAVEWGAIN